jgi:two-component system, cell cycle sensor histidine kinase and response regulator CckA
MKIKIRTKLLLGLVIVLTWIVLIALHTLANIEDHSGLPTNIDTTSSALIMGLFFLISATLGFLFWRSISRSLDNLTRGAEAFGRDDLDYRIKVESDDELGLLAKTLNSMTANLAQTRQALQLQSKITENMHEGIHLARTNDYSIVYTNPRFEEMFGYSPGELNGQPISIINAPTENDPEETAALITAAVTEYGFWRGEVHNIKKDGSLFWCEASVSAFDHPEHGAVTISIHTDISERKRADHLQDATYRIAQAADHAENLGSLYAAIHAIIQEVMVADNFYIAVYDEQNDLISFPYCVDQVDPLYPPFKPGMGLTEYVLNTGISLLCDDTLFDELIKQGTVELIGVNSPIWLGVPLIVVGKTIGVMVVQDYKNARAYGKREQRILEFVSSQAAMAIHRKQAEETLQESEARYRAVVEDQPVLLFRFDLDHTITFANQAYCDFHGKLPAEIIGRNLLELIGEIEKPNVARAREQIARLTPENPTAVHEHGAVNAQGKLIWFQWTDRLLFDQDGSPFEYQTLGLDITERKQAEETLQESEARFRSIVENTQAGYFFIDRDGQYQDVNNAWVKMHGYASADEIIGEHFIIAQRDDDVGEAAKVFNAIMAGNPEYMAAEFSRKCKDGSIGHHSFSARPVTRHGEVIGIEGFLIDITNLKHAEETLKEQRSFLKQVIDSIPNGILVKDRASRYVLTNQTMAEALGSTPEELIGRCEGDVYYDKEVAVRFAQEDLEVMDTLQEKFILEQENFHAGGEYRWVQVTKRPLIGLDGKADQVLTVLVNITERKKFEEAMVESQKLAALGTLAAGIAHEINSPLQVITGTSESLQRQLGANKLALEDLPRRLAAINRNAWRVAGIVRSLLSYARPSGGKQDPQDLNVLVKETLLLIEHQLKTWSNINVITEMESGMPTLTCDSEKLSQVLINLLNNARDAMPNGGDVTIRTRYDSSKNRFTLEVTDNGEGIAEEDRSRIFDPFFTTKAVGEGTGLGLSIIQGIIQAHGGEIKVDSAVKVGTSFTIHLPQEPPPALDIEEGGRYSKYL